MLPEASQRRASPAALASARTSIEQLIAASGAVVGVAWRPLDEAGGDPAEQILINATTRFHAASTMKVPVMIELFRQAEAGQLRLDDALVLTNRFRSIVDGSPYALSVSDDSDRGLYASIGRSVTARALCEAMIIGSSNLAANTLIEKVGARNIQATVDALGAPAMQVLRGLEDQKAFEAGLNNTTDAFALLTLFWKLGRGEVVSQRVSANMVEILKRQTFDDAIPAGLPPGTVVAHKTGTITRVHHDAGIIFGARPYVLVVLVRGIEDQNVSAKLIAAIARTAHKITNRTDGSLISASPVLRH